MPKVKIEASTFKFLKDLSKNNNREWFNKHKPKFQVANANMKAFVGQVETEMNKVDLIDKTKLFRIYKDVRFSKDKTPYNTHFSFSLSRATDEKRGGYYVRVTPKESTIACGFWRPEPKDMKLIRDHIAADAAPLRKILKSKTFIKHFGTLEGEQVKTAPRGFDKTHPNIDLIKHKQFIVYKPISDKVVCSDQFLKEIVSTFKAVRPFFDYMSEILTHDLNGVSLLKK